MMTDKYIIQMMHHRAIGDNFPYYYKGQNREGAACFDFRKNLAKRYELREEALRDMRFLEAIYVDKRSDDFSIVTVRCRV